MYCERFCTALDHLKDRSNGCRLGDREGFRQVWSKVQMIFSDSNVGWKPYAAAIMMSRRRLCGNPYR